VNNMTGQAKGKVMGEAGERGEAEERVGARLREGKKL